MANNQNKLIKSIVAIAVSIIALFVFVYLQNKLHFFSKSNASFDSDTTIEFGKVETVFNYASMHCPNELSDFPDMTAKAFVDATGRTQLIAGNSLPNRRSVGNNLTDVVHDCGNPILKSEFNTDPSKSRDFSWVMSPYVVETAPGLPIVALVHNEYHGYQTAEHLGFSNCSITDASAFLKCWWGSVNLAISTDNGANFKQASSPNQIVSSIGFDYKKDNKEHYGAMEPSNIVFRNNYYYSLVTVQTPTSSPPFVKGGTCLMRTNSLLDAKSWRYWDGSGFSIPAENATNCTPVLPSGWSLSLSYNSYLNLYISLGCQWQSQSCMRFSSDLINWSATDTPLNAPGYYVYGSFLQPGDQTRNYEVDSRSPWFYFVSCGNGNNSNYCNGNNRNLKRVRVRFNKIADLGKYPLLDLRFSELLGNKTLDSSFYVNDGAFNGDAKLGIDSTSRYASFKGNGSLVVPNSSSLSVNNTFSINLRLRTSMIPASSNFPTLLAKTDSSKRNYGLYMTPSGKLHFSTMNGVNFSGTVGSKKINDGQWHDVIIVYNQATQKVAYYIDGNLDSLQSQSGKLSDGVNNGSLVIGADKFIGDIDSLAIYNFALK